MTSIDEFVTGLAAIPAAEFTTDRVEDYLRETLVDPGTLEPFLNFASTHYTRNLVYRCPLFELMTICWDVGQVSRIHNHAGQQCWMAVPVGKLDVQNYEVVEIDRASGYCRLREANRFVRGLVAWIGFRQTAVYYDRKARFAGIRTTRCTKCCASPAMGSSRSRRCRCASRRCWG